MGGPRLARSVIVALIGLFWSGDTARSAVSCTITPITGGYGSVDVLTGTVFDSTVTLTVSCSGAGNSEVVRLCLNIGAGVTALGPANERVLRSSTDYLDHEYYSDASRTQVWGSWGVGAAAAYPTASPAGIQRDVTMNSSGSGSFNYTVYARILASQQTKTPGSYSWTAGSPTVEYKKQSSSSACPTGGNSSDAGSSSFTATVVSNCNITANALNFGSSSSLASNIDATTTIVAQCSNTLPYSIGLDNGSNASGAQRRMKQGASNFISYNLYTNSGRTSAWTTTTSASSCTGGAGTCITGTGTGGNQTVTVYGRVPSQSNQAPGTYTDTVLVTFTF